MCYAAHVTSYSVIHRINGFPLCSWRPPLALHATALHIPNRAHPCIPNCTYTYTCHTTFTCVLLTTHTHTLTHMHTHMPQNLHLRLPNHTHASQTALTHTRTHMPHHPHLHLCSRILLLLFAARFCHAHIPNQNHILTHPHTCRTTLTCVSAAAFSSFFSLHASAMLDTASLRLSKSLPSSVAFVR